MPPIRSVKGRQEGENTLQLTWAPTLDISNTQTTTISFAPNVTPVTYTAPPSDEDDTPSESILFPDTNAITSSSLLSNSSTSKRRRKAGTTDDEPGSPAHIPRPPNAFILFRSSFIKSQQVSASIEGNHGTLSKIVGMVWHNLPYEERQVWQAKARKALAEHRKKYPTYTFKPKDKEKDKKLDDASSIASSRDGSAPPKRRQRETGFRDVERCEKIAALVAKGTRGAELEEAIKAFDAAREPTVITPRFEKPITAQQFEVEKKVKVEVHDEEQQSTVRQYRRSSSAPLLDVEHTENVRKQSRFMHRSDSPLQQTSPASVVTSQSQSPSTPTFRTHRKRSASSSPPVRHRPLQPSASFPSLSQTSTFSHGQAYAPQLTIQTNQLQMFQNSQPMSAPVLSHQQSLLLNTEETGCSTPQSDPYFDIDSAPAASWYHENSASSPASVSSADSQFSYHQSQEWSSPSFDFGNYNFASAVQCPTPVSAVSQQSFSPFEQASGQVAPEDLSGMTSLVERPYDSLGSMSIPTDVHHNPLSIETSWSSRDFEYECQVNASPLDDQTHNATHATASMAYGMYSAIPPQTHDTVPFDMDMYHSESSLPRSPSSTSVSDVPTQAQTPRESSLELYAEDPSSASNSCFGTLPMYMDTIHDNSYFSQGKDASHPTYSLDVSQLHSELSRYA